MKVTISKLYHVSVSSFRFYSDCTSNALGFNIRVGLWTCTFLLPTSHDLQPQPYQDNISLNPIRKSIEVARYVSGIMCVLLLLSSSSLYARFSTSELQRCSVTHTFVFPYVPQ